jgi:signal transduction histidine kinase
MIADTFERLRASLASTFGQLPAAQIDSHITGALARIGAFLRVERATLYELSTSTALTAAEWCGAGTGAPPQITRDGDPARFKNLLERPGVLATDAAALPVVWAASMPLKIGGETVGALQVASTTRPRPWNAELSDQLSALADVLGNALVRKRTACALDLVVRELQQARRDGREREQRFTLAEAALAASGGRLMEAQEVERSRIARELHDDICQRLAVLGIEIQQLSTDVPAAAQSRLDALFHGTVEISTDVQALSHQLHCSKLEFLGIVAAIKGFCGEFARQQDATIEFTSSGIPTHLPRDVSLCLFRVAQEALRNAIRHSGVRELEVKLQGMPTMVMLMIRDRGRGFDPEAAIGGRGLGLVSMRERVTLLNGTIVFSSKRGSGTEICLRLPMDGSIERRGGSSASTRHVYMIPSGRASVRTGDL